MKKSEIVDWIRQQLNLIIQENSKPKTGDELDRSYKAGKLTGQTEALAKLLEFVMSLD